MQRTLDSFARNRAEEHGPDLWEDFVIPPFFSQLEYGRQRKPVRFVGGRGCGKTTLLRYLSHRSQLSTQRLLLSRLDLVNIGIYYRSDTQYLSTFSGGDIADKEWQSIFGHALCLALTEELLDCFKRVLNREALVKLENGLSQAPINFSEIQDFDSTLPTELETLTREIRRRRRQLSTWVNNSDSTTKPRLFPLKDFLSTIISQVQEQVYCLKETVFNVLIDEYENLLDYQQLEVNTLLKHSEPPLVFHIAMKRNGMPNTKTLGNESLQEEADYRTIDIEERLQDNFSLFCAELMFFRLIQVGGYPEDSTPISVRNLRSIDTLEERFQNVEYRSRVLEAARRILPEVGTSGIARLALSDEGLRNGLRKLLERGLQRRHISNAKPDDFIRHTVPEASVVSAALIHQESKNPIEILAELQKLSNGQPSKFQSQDWIHHYVNGVLFLLYLRLQRPCLLYAGFDSFIKLARFNIRHFLELCHLAISKTSPASELDALLVHVDQQSGAAKEASAFFINDIKGSGVRGNRLYQLAQSLGQIFRLSQERPSQSEAERTHFAITRGDMNDESRLILSEAVKWSVLLEEKETKVKNVRYESREYRLNPIYAPFFGISYNKGRKVDFTSKRANALLSGTAQEIESVIKDFKKDFDVEDSGEPTLF